MNASFPRFEQFDVLIVLSRTENQSNRRFLSGATFIPLEPGQIKLHLAFVRRFEIAYLELYGHQAAQLAMIEQQVKVIILVIDLHPFLASDEAKAGSEFENEGLDFPKNRGLQIRLGIGIFQAEEIKDIRIAENEVGRQLVLLA